MILNGRSMLGIPARKMRLNWTIFEADGRKVEAQVFEPDRPTQNAILFCPGLPGVGGSLFEQRHAAALAAEGYAVIVLHHSGIRLDGPHAPLMVNNGWRRMMARQNGETHLGGGPSTIDHWLLEPLVALKNLAYENLTVIGNSFGALSSMWSLTSAGAPLGNIRNLILLAGAQGMEEVMRIWRPEFLTMPRITEKVTLNDPDDIVATLRGVYQKLPQRMASLPAIITLTYLVVARDELLYLSDTEQFRAAIGGRGNIVIDEIDKAWPDHGFMAHDMPDYPTVNLLALIRGI